jgi:hypothetical protein
MEVRTEDRDDSGRSIVRCTRVEWSTQRRRANHPRDLDFGLFIGLHHTPNIGWIAATAERQERSIANRQECLVSSASRMPCTARRSLWSVALSPLFPTPPPWQHPSSPYITGSLAASRYAVVN